MRRYLAGPRVGEVTRGEEGSVVVGGFSGSVHYRVEDIAKYVLTIMTGEYDLH